MSSADDDEFSKRQLFIHDSICTVDEITALCKKQIQENGIQVIVVDYLQLMKSYKLSFFKLIMIEIEIND